MTSDNAFNTHHSALRGEHAIVIGGSMAGLLAARVLADHFEQITVIERDHFPDSPVPRKGTPHARHFHLLLVQGRIILEQLFPGITQALADLGAPVLDLFTDMLWVGPAGPSPRTTSDFITVTCSRDLLEWHVRQRMAQHPRVRFVERNAVVALLPNTDASGVSGVRIRLHEYQADDGISPEDLTAQLVVDASGRSSRLPEWLQALGYPAPEETIVDSGMCYATRLYMRPPDFAADWKAIYLQTRPPTLPRGGALFPIEDHRWILSVVSPAPHEPPADEAEFLDFVGTLSSPLIYNVIKDAQPLSPIHRYQRTTNRLLHYERLARWPEHLVVVGDAVCAFNPIYGQGMTAAAIGALMLDQCIREHPRKDLTGLAKLFQRRLARCNAVPWLMATGEDYRYPHTKGGRRTWQTRLIHWYMDHIIRLASQKLDICHALAQVIHLRRPPTTLFQPAIVARVAGHVLGNKRRAEHSPT